MSFVQAVHQSLGPSSPPTLPAPWSAQPLNRGPVEPGCAGPIDRAGEDDATTLEMAGLLAVYADSLRRIAKAEADHYETNIERRLRAKGLDERQLIEIGTQLGDRVIGLLERVLLMVLMFYFREPGTAVLAGLDLVEHGPAVDLPPAHLGHPHRSCHLTRRRRLRRDRQLGGSDRVVCAGRTGSGEPGDGAALR
jgi:hypothetical protein